MTELSHAVFLSYASQDAEAAQKICEALRAAGIEAWFDQSELRGGDVWDRQIRKHIHDCALFVPIISSTTQARLEGYFRREWKLAVDRSHDMAEGKPFLVPVVIDDTKDKDAEVPESFRAVQWTRLPQGETPPAFVERVARLLSPNPQTQPSSGFAPSPLQAIPRPSASRRSIPAPALITVAVAIVGIGYLAVDKFFVPKRPTGGAHTEVSAGQAGVHAQSTMPENSIAVLPFTDLSEKRDQEYFADGMAEEIINLLVKIPELKVIGRTSSFQFKGKTDDLRKIGTTLGAAYAVEGSVRRAGDRVRVTAQLIETRDGTHRWSETYDRETSDTLTVQHEIAASMARALQVETTTLSHLQGRPLPKNSEAYDSYLRGLHAFDRGDQRGFEEAAAHFRRALAADPSFAPAAEQLARVLFDLVDYGFVPGQTGWEQARAAAEAALKLDSKSAEAHGVLGWLHLNHDWDWPAAEREARTAVTLGPNEPHVLWIAAYERDTRGQWNEALRFAETAITADPLFTTGYNMLGGVYVELGRLAEAESAARSMLEISPTRAGGHTFLAQVLLLQGKTEAALAEVQKEPPGEAQTQALALIDYALHRTKDADAALARLGAEHAGDAASDIADVYAFRNQKDQAFKWLDRAYAQKDNGLLGIKGDPLLKNLRGDPRYKAFLRKMNLPE